jgi:DNA repair exonuclease SbcCD ATPase subunit
MDLVSEYRDIVDTYKDMSGRLREKELYRDSLAAEIKSMEDELVLLVDSIEILEAASSIAQQTVFDKIDELVTESLQVIKEDDSISIKSELLHKRGQPEAVFGYRDGVSPVYGDLLYTHGGGIVDIMSCALRLIVAELLGVKGAIVFDEPFRMLHSECASYERNAVNFLKEFSHRRNRQLIIITHSEEISSIGDKVFRVVQNNKRSTVEVVSE